MKPTSNAFCLINAVFRAFVHGGGKWPYRQCTASLAVHRLSALAAIRMKVLTFKCVFFVRALFGHFVTPPRFPARKQNKALHLLLQVGKGIQAFLLPCVVSVVPHSHLPSHLLVSNFYKTNVPGNWRKNAMGAGCCGPALSVKYGMLGNIWHIVCVALQRRRNWSTTACMPGISFGVMGRVILHCPSFEPAEYILSRHIQGLQV